MRSKYSLATMALFASCFTSSTTTYAFIAPGASLVWEKQSPITSSLHALSNDQNNIEGEKDILFTAAVASGWRPERGHFAGITRRNTKPTSTALGMSDDLYAVIPDGGLSPCVIKVVGVGGGGCNAVSSVWLICFLHVFSFSIFAQLCSIVNNK